MTIPDPNGSSAKATGPRTAAALPGRPLKLAAIDIGTNSIHSIIAAVAEDGTFEVVDRFKEMVRLGEEQTEAHGLTSRAIGEGLAALSRTKQLCDSHQVDRICAVATSAVREAPNGAEFLNLVRRQTGLRVNAITAQEEARLVHQAVAHSLDLEGRKALIVDIGGGSVEMIVGSQRECYFADSAKVGVLRLRDRFPLSDPPAGKELDRIREHVSQQLKWMVSQVRDAGFEEMVGTSGTILALVQLARAEGKSPGRLHGTRVTRRKLSAVVQRLSRMTLKEREGLSGLSARRADTILPGAILFERIMEELKIEEFRACTWALREGVLIDYLERHQPQLRAVATFTDPRRRSVMALAARCQWHEKHSRQVASLALQLFDGLKPIHQLEPAMREVLEFGCYLHDIGYLVSAEDHHKHSRYLVMNGGLLGFTQQEVQLVGALSRYHRGRTPKKRDEELEGLPAKARRAAEILAGILRVADGLDRTHNSLVHRVECHAGPLSLDIHVFAHGEAELEMWYARKKSDLLTEALGVPVRLKLDHSAAEAPKPPAREKQAHVGNP